MIFLGARTVGDVHGAGDFTQNIFSESDFVEQWTKGYPKLLRRARILASSCSDDAEDLLSQATVKVLRYSRETGHMCDVEALIYISLRQVHIDNRRNGRQRIFDRAAQYQDGTPCHQRDPGRDDPEQHLITQEALEQVLKIVGMQKPIYQLLFRMRFLQGKSYPEIARRTGMTEAGARQCIRRLRQKLAKQMCRD